MLDLLAALPFVESSNVNLEKRGDLVGFIRGEVEFRGEVTSSDVPSLEQVLREIEEFILYR